MLRLLWALAVIISAPISLYVIHQGVTRIWETMGGVMTYVAVIAFIVTMMSIAALFDKRHPPERHWQE